MAVGAARSLGQSIGTLWVGLALDPQRTGRHHLIDGDPNEVRNASIALALADANAFLRLQRPVQAPH
jgi:hypothetical protein